MGGDTQEDPFLRVSIDCPKIKLDLKTRPTKGALSEVRRIVELLSGDEPLCESMEEASLYELRGRLSEEFFHHPDLAGRVKNSLIFDEDIRVVKRVIPFEREYDLVSGKETQQVNVLNVKGSITKLFETLDTKKVRECLVHIRGELSREQQCVIMDAIKQHVGMVARTRFFSTTKSLEGNFLVEAVCFGEGISLESEW